MFGNAGPSRATRMLPAAAVTVFGAIGLGLGAATDTAVSLPAAPVVPMVSEPTVTLPVRLMSNDSGPHSDVSGPHDTDSDNVAPPPPDSGTGMECEDAGVACDHDQSGTALTSDNDEV